MRNYNKVNSVIEKPVIEEQMIEEQVVEESIVEEPVVFKTGIVIDCSKLNVRKEPNANAQVVTVINVEEKVTINEKESTKDFYKIYTANSIEGYCMKKFIAV